jgi:hypothetical protein
MSGRKNAFLFFFVFREKYAQSGDLVEKTKQASIVSTTTSKSGDPI